MARVSADKDGQIEGFSYHDGSLDGVVAANDGKELHLALRSVEGERRVLTLRNLKAVHVKGFREGNIVLDLSLFSSDEAARIDELKSSLKTRLYLDADQLPPDAKVFWLAPSFGADIVAVCGEVEVSEVGVTLALIR